MIKYVFTTKQVQSAGTESASNYQIKRWIADNPLYLAVNDPCAGKMWPKILAVARSGWICWKCRMYSSQGHNLVRYVC